MYILLYLAIGFTIFCMIVALAVPILLRPSPQIKRLFQVVTSTRSDRRTVGKRERLEDELFIVVRDLRLKLGITVSDKLRGRLYSAGFRSAAAPDLFFAAVWLGPLMGVFAGSFMRDNTLFWIAAFAAVGYVAPNFWLTEMIRHRQEKIRRSLPDVIDLLVICVDAGLGLDQALLRVGEELILGHKEIQEELSRVHLEQRAGRPRVEAWQNLAQRVQVVELTAFVSMLTQAERFGTPIIRALGRFADELRMKRRQRGEEAAAKTKIKIVFPLVFCIFPCLFIVLLAPALLSISSIFGGIGK